MAEPQYRHLTGQVDQDILVLTITNTAIQDEKSADALLEELLNAVSHFAVHKIVIDMQRLKYISSVAFRPLLKLRGRLKEIDGRMILCGLTPVVGDIFYTTKMLSPSGSFEAPFRMAADVEAAVKRLKREAAEE